MTERQPPASIEPAEPPDAAGPAADGDVRLGALADFLGFHLRIAQEASYRAFLRRILSDEELGGLTLKPGHLTVFTLLAENPGITQTALSRASGRDKSTLTPVVEDFARRGFIEKRRLPEDRRSYALTLTPLGETLHRRLAAHAATHEADLDRIVGSDHKADLIGLLRRIKTSLS